MDLVAEVQAQSNVSIASGWKSVQFDGQYLTNYDIVFLAAQSASGEIGPYICNPNGKLTPALSSIDGANTIEVRNGTSAGNRWQPVGGIWQELSKADSQLNNLTQLTVPKKLGSNIVGHAVHYQLSDFGSPVVAPFTDDGASPGTLNTSGTWTANNAAFAAALAAGGTIEIPEGLYWVTDPMLISVSNTKLRCLGERVRIAYGYHQTSPGVYAHVDDYLLSFKNSGGTIQACAIEGRLELSAQNSMKGIFRLRNQDGFRADWIDLLYAVSDDFAIRYEPGATVCTRAHIKKLRIFSSLFAVYLGGGFGHEIDSLKITGGTLIGLKYDGAYGTHIVELEHSGDANIGLSALASNAGLGTQGITNADDMRGIIVTSNSDNNENVIDSAHLEASSSTYPYIGVGLALDIQKASSLWIGNLGAPNWRVGYPTAGGPFPISFTDRSGTLTPNGLPRLPYQAIPGRPLSSPDSTATWSESTAKATVTTTTTSGQFYFSLNQNGSAFGIIQKIHMLAVVTGGAVGATFLDIAHRDLTTGTVTVIETFTVANGANTFANTDGASSFWDGFVGYSTDISCPYEVIAIFRSTPSVSGVAATLPPRIEYSGGFEKPAPDPTKISDCVLWVPGKTGSLANLGSQKYSALGHGNATLITGVMSFTAAGDYYTQLLTAAPAVDWTFACCGQLSTASGFQIFAEIFANGTSGSSTGIAVSSFAGKWQLYIQGGGFVDTGISSDTSLHRFIITYVASTHTTNVWIDGTLRVTSTTYTVNPDKRILMGLDSGSGSAACATRSPIVVLHAATINEIAYLDKVLSAA